MQKNIQIVLQKIEEVWWAKVLVAILLAIPLLIFWPFTIGGTLAYLAFKHVASPKVKWTLVTLILMPTLIIGSVWVSVVFYPTPSHLDLDAVPPTNQSQATISGKTLSGKLVEVLKGGQVVAETTADEAGRFRIEVKDLAEGENQFVVRVCEEKEEQEDVAQCIEKAITILVDKTPPPPPLIKDYPATSESDQVTVGGATEKGAKVRVFVGEDEKGVVEAGQDGTFEANVPLSEGKNKVKAQAIDQAGNVSEFSKAVVITYQPPPPSEETETGQPATEPEAVSEEPAKPQTMLDKLWIALDSGIGKREGYDIEYDESIKDAILTFYSATFWDENSLVRDSYTALVKFGREAFNIEGVGNITIVFKTDFTDSYGEKSQDEAVIITMNKENFNKFNWDNLKMELVSRQIEAASEAYYIHPAVRKNLNEDKLWLSI